MTFIEATLSNSITKISVSASLQHAEEVRLPVRSFGWGEPPLKRPRLRLPTPEKQVCSSVEWHVAL